MGRRSKRFGANANSKKVPSKKSESKIEGKKSNLDQHSDEAQAKLFFDLGIRYDDLGKWFNAADAFEKAIHIYKKLEDDESVREVEVLLGNCFLNQGKNEKAEIIFRKHLKTSPENQSEATASAFASSGLGLIASEMKNHMEAEEHFKLSLTLWQKVQGEKSERVSFIRNQLSWVYMELENFTAAEEQIMKALKICNSLRTNDAEEKFCVNDDLACLNGRLAEICRKTKRFAKAEEHFKKSLKYLESTPEAIGKNVANTLENFGKLYYDQDKFAEAEECWKKAMKIAISEEYHLRIAELTLDFGGIYLQQGKTAEAKEKFKEALNLFISHLGENHKRVSQVRYLVMAIELSGERGRIKS